MIELAPKLTNFGNRGNLINVLSQVRFSAHGEYIVLNFLFFGLKLVLEFASTHQVELINLF
jgi:hypothetical protein